MRLLALFRYVNFKMLFNLIQSVTQRRLPGLAAEMAYSNALAIFPGIVGVLTIIGTFNISPEQIDFVAQQWLQIAPPEVVQLIDSFMQQIHLSNSETVFSISFFLTIWIASSAISVAMAAMDQIYQTPLQARRPFWKARSIAILLTFGTLVALFGASFLIFISDLMVEVLSSYLTLLQSDFWQAWSTLRWLFAFVLLIVGFSALYRYGPSQWQVGTPLMPGAIVGALLWALISQGFRLYLAHFGSRLNFTYGTLTAGVLLLLWLNLSSLALLLGAQFNVTLRQAIMNNCK